MSFKQQEFWNSHEGTYKRALLNKKIRKTILGLLDKTDISGILDVGCGAGDLGFFLASSGTKKSITGVDFSDFQLKSTSSRTFADINNNKKLYDNLIKANSLSLPFSDNSFDVVVCINVLQDWDEQKAKKIVEEISRVSRKYLLISIESPSNKDAIILSYILNTILKRTVVNFHPPQTIREMLPYPIKDFKTIVIEENFPFSLPFDADNILRLLLKSDRKTSIELIQGAETKHEKVAQVLQTFEHKYNESFNEFVEEFISTIKNIGTSVEYGFSILFIELEK